MAVLATSFSSLSHEWVLYYSAVRHYPSSVDEEIYSRCFPHYRRVHGPMVGSRVQFRLIIAVEAHLRALIPQNAAIQIRARDAEERQVRDREGELDEDERPQHAVEPP